LNDDTLPGTFEHMSEQRASSDRDQLETLGSPVAEQGAARDPEEWVTGDEPMTGPQRSYLDNLARQAGEELPADLTKAEASEHIERLQQVNARARLQ
jgi:hypothetical protein